jgi:micrococcal nuclease
MARKASILALLGVLTLAAAAAAPSGVHRAQWFELRGKVTRVVDGDTVHVRVGNRTEKVRLIGIDSPEVGACYAAQSGAGLRRLVLGKQVVLSGDRTQTRRDVYKRLLAYVNLTSGLDTGRYQLQQGFADVYETRRRFARQGGYEAAAAASLRAGKGLHGACHSKTPSPSPTPVQPVVPPAAGCAASYPDVCIAPPPPDLDCGQVTHRRFRVIHTVPSPDPHRFDGDRDGIGCES